jgi:3-oxoacyl-[acyl-carrier protein] reductase
MSYDASDKLQILKKCNNCGFYVEVAGGPDHGDYRCTNSSSPAFDQRLNELEKSELSLVVGCLSRRGKKTVLITGASRGIGKGIAESFADQGFDVALVSRRLEDVAAVAEELTSKKWLKGIYLPFECDIRDPQQVKKTFQEVYRQFGSIDVLVNNAGINSRVSLNPKNPDRWCEDFESNLNGWNDEILTNLTGVYVCSYVAVGYMLQQNSGIIINISSIKGKEPTSSPGYGASKAGIIKLTKDFAKALASNKIRVNCIAPGFIDTGMTAELSEDKKQMYVKMIPQGRFGGVEEIAKVAVFLSSDASSYITGATIDVNGGYLMS